MQWLGAVVSFFFLASLNIISLFFVQLKNGNDFMIDSLCPNTVNNALQLLVSNISLAPKIDVCTVSKWPRVSMHYVCKCAKGWCVCIRVDEVGMVEYLWCGCGWLVWVKQQNKTVFSGPV